MNPKGKLIIIGGAEDKGGEDTPEIRKENGRFEHFEILKILLPKKKNKKLGIITTASEAPEKIKPGYTRAFKEVGYQHIDFLNIKSKEEARDEKNLKRIDECGAVLFSGGDQFRLSTIIGGTLLGEKLKEKYFHDENFTVAGTSAGAMALTEVMIYEGGKSEALIATETKTCAGLGFINRCIIDTHFIKRGRFGRLAHAVTINPNELGIGLGEDTALLIENGTEGTCFGSGMVVVIDGTDIRHTNIMETYTGEPVFVDHLVVHLLIKGCRFSLKTREMIKPEMLLKSSKN
jgi:cyanophycinase